MHLDESLPSAALALVLAPDLRAQLERALALVRKTPEDAEARLVLAGLLLRAERRPEMYRQIEYAMKYAPPHWGGQEELGALLFRAGELKAAAQVLDSAIQSGRIGGEGLRIRSALHTRDEEPGPARRLLGAAALIDPISKPDPNLAHMPQVLRLRCVDHSRYTISRNRQTGLWSRRFRSGHFSLRDLLDHRSVAMTTVTTYADSILSTDTPPADLIINTMACADLNPEALRHAATWTSQQSDVHVLNPPDKVLRTTRARVAERLRQIPHVETPRTDLLHNDAEPDDMVSRLEALDHRFPVILRRAGTQTGISVERADDTLSARRYFANSAPGEALYAITYHDLRDSAGNFRKTRAFFIDGEFHPVANLVSDHWQIHSGDRYRIMSDMADAQARERAYLNDPANYLGADAWKALHAIRDEIGLDFFGVDFTVLENGSVFVFEANAAMRHNYDHASRFPYTRPHLDRIGRSFTAMVLRRLNQNQASTGAQAAT